MLLCAGVHRRRMLFPEFLTRAGRELLRADDLKLQRHAHRSRLMVRTRLRGTAHQHRRDLQSRRADRCVQHAAARLACASIEPDTGRSVVVRINDRGPYVRGRSIDLSHGAARQIGLMGEGVGRVEVTPTATSTPRHTPNGLRCRRRAREVCVTFRTRSRIASTRATRIYHYPIHSSPRMVVESDRRMARKRIPALLSERRSPLQPQKQQRLTITCTQVACSQMR